MKKAYIAICIIVLLMMVPFLGYYLYPKKSPKKECSPCGEGGLIILKKDYFGEDKTLDTRNVGYWRASVQENHRTGVKISHLDFYVKSGDGRVFPNISGRVPPAAYDSKIMGVDDPHEYYITESYPGAARYDLDYGVDGKKDRLNSSFTWEHLRTLENVTGAIYDFDSNGELNQGDMIFFFREYSLANGEKINIISNDYADLLLNCDGIYMMGWSLIP